MLGGLIWTSFHIADSEIGGGWFWIEWIAMRSKIIDGLSPYSTTTSERIQSQIDQLFTWIPGEDVQYTSPIFTGVVALPFAFIPDPLWARTAWLAVQFIVILLTFLGAARLVGWKPAWYIFTLVALPVLLGLWTVSSWLEGSLVIWVNGLVVGVLLAIQSKRYDLAGILLALTMIQPMAVILLVVFILIWAGSRRMSHLIIWFFAALAVLIAVGLFLSVDWLLEYIRILWNYREVYLPGTPGSAFQTWWPGFGHQLGWVFTGLMAVILGLEWWLALRRDFRWFLWTACLTVVISQWIGIPSRPDHYLLLILPILLIFARLDERFPVGGRWAALVGLLAVTIWEWWLFNSILIKAGSTSFWGLIFPLPFLLLIGLVWVRWWAIRPERMLIEDLRFSEPI